MTTLGQVVKKTSTTDEQVDAIHYNILAYRHLRFLSPLALIQIWSALF